MIEKYVDAEELRRLLSALVVIVGFLAIAGLFASIVVPGLRNANRPETPTAVAPVVGESGWLNPEEFPPQRGGVVPPVDPKSLIQPSTELIARGKTLFENNCTQCHGPIGHGDGSAANTMNPRPRNFSSPDSWTNGYNLPGIFKTLSAGVKDTSMASFDYLSRKDRMALAHYVQSLGTFSHNTANPQAMEALSKELAAPGETIPNKIPVSMAMAKIEEEFVAAPPLAISREDQSAGGEILRRVVMNPARAGQVLRESQLWRVSPENLAASILPDVPDDGFSVSTAFLSPSEWQALHAELLRLIEPK